ncbi:MAG: phenylalanine--tRNA ligase subunit beta, partial [Epsilonproteobacteria bacterium]|nr:phenylalanine--tRNA ligase subunit beta [Campylobacterota bacterium]
ISLYAAHSSGVILRGYDFDKLSTSEDGRVDIKIEEVEEGIVEVRNRDNLLSIVGVNQNEEFKATNGPKILVEASYINPLKVIEGVSRKKLPTDRFYANSSKGSEPDIGFGMKHLKKSFCENGKCSYTQSSIDIGKEPESRVVTVDFKKINSIIGEEIPRSEIANILLLLGFSMSKIGDDLYAVNIPPYRHDISNIYDIAEEVLRIYGIDNIKSSPLKFVEKNRINDVYLEFRQKEALLNRAVGVGFFNAITYAFANKELLLKYKLDVVDEDIDIINPIVKELSTLRTTILLNLVEAASRNIKYGKKRVALVEIGTIFGTKREEKEVVSFLFSGEEQRASVRNRAKAKMVELSSFIEKIGGVIGDFELKSFTPTNSFFHPYMSAKVIKDNKEVGVVAKLHPKVAKDFDLDDTFLAEFNLADILPKEKKAKELSNYQPVTKDLSVVIDKDLNFYDIAKALKEFQESEPLLRDFYPLDIYSDEKLGDKKSLTIRFILQSDSKTLSDSEIEAVISSILKMLEERFGAKLR